MRRNPRRKESQGRTEELSQSESERTDKSARRPEERRRREGSERTESRSKSEKDRTAKESRRQREEQDRIENARQAELERLENEARKNDDRRLRESQVKAEDLSRTRPGPSDKPDGDEHRSDRLERREADRDRYAARKDGKRIEDPRQEIVTPKDREPDPLSRYTAVAMPAIAAIAGPLTEARHEDPIAQPAPSKWAVDKLADEDIFDPSLFKKTQGGPVGQRSSDTTNEVFEDWKQRYSEAPVSAAEFFAPPELLDRSASRSPLFDPNSGADVRVYEAHSPQFAATPKGPPYPPPYAFRTTKDGSKSHMTLPYAVPSLNLIHPTPPGSTPGSVISPSPPTSPPAARKEQPAQKEPAVPAGAEGCDVKSHVGRGQDDPL